MSIAAQPVPALELDPLSVFLPSDLELSAMPLEDGAAMPEPYRSLLVHRRDMTSTLERFHGEPVALRELDRRRDRRTLYRQVVLVGERSVRPFEFGAIRIELAAFATEARWAILDGHRPLGAILAQFRVAYDSRPQSFFSLDADPAAARFLGDHRPLEATLYGRCNLLLGDGGETLAEVVEILPPIDGDASR